MTGGGWKKAGRWRNLWRDCSGQSMTEYVIVTAVMVAIAAWLYYPDNHINIGMRHTYDKTALIVSWPGP